MNKTIANMSLDNFVNAACCVIEPATGRAELSLAGHAAPLWFQAEGGTVGEVGGGALPIGIDGDARFETTEISLRKGDVLAFFTDGIVDAFDPHGAQYGMERFREQLARWGEASAGEICTQIRQDLDLHCQSHRPQDDCAFLLARRISPGP